MKKISLFLLMALCAVFSLVLFGVRRNYQSNPAMSTNGSVVVQAVEAEEEKKEEEAKKPETMVDQVLAGVKGVLKPYWEAFQAGEWKALFKEKYKSEMQFPTKSAKVIKGVKVTKRGELDPEYSDEGKFINKRLDVARPVLEKFTGLNFYQDNERVPRIGCAFSGGGYRAMIFTTGVLKALDDIGLLDGVMNISTLSGSTLCLGSWIFMQNPTKKVTPAEFEQTLLEKIKNNRFNIFSTNPAKDFDKDQVQAYAEKVFWPKIIYDQVYGSVNVFGALLAHYLLPAVGNKSPQLLRLSDQLYSVKSGNAPWPSYSAVSMHQADGKYWYNWYEFNPEEVRNLEKNLAIPSFAFGRSFDKGESTDLPPRESFGFLMGIFGSAYAVNIQDLIDKFFGDIKVDVDFYNKELKEIKNFASKMPPNFLGIWNSVTGATKKTLSPENLKELVSKLAMAVFKAVLSKIGDQRIDVKESKIGPLTLIKESEKKIQVGTARVSPAQVNNPFKNYEGVEDWLQTRSYITMVDAGISYNIPLLPLFRPERQMNLIIVGDTSENVATAGSKNLEQVLGDVKRLYGLTYTKREGTKSMEIWRTDQEAYSNVGPEFAKVKPPVILYFNSLRDDKLMNERAAEDPALKKLVDDNKLRAFNQAECIQVKDGKLGFCSSFSFNYTEDQLKQVSGIGEFNVKAHENTLKILVEEAAESRKEEEESMG